MKINCTRERVDTDKILYEIDVFRMGNRGDRPSYIIMNYKTRNDILDSYYFNYSTSASPKGDKLFGIPVAYNEGLEFGEIDIV